MKVDVFVSHHTDSSLHIVEAIVNQLEGRGIRCWYAPRNTTGAYAESITKAIEACRVFLLILNQPSSKSFHVLNELDIVCKRLAGGADVKIIPFHVADEVESLHKDAIYYICRMHWIDAMKPPIYSRINELTDTLCGLLGGVSPTEEAALRETAAPHRLVGNVPQARDVFVGREELLQQIHDTFAGGVRTVYLEGMGGIGKSELAKQYALHHREDYDTVVFFPYENSLRQAICSQTAVTVEGLSQRPEEDEAAFFARKLQLIKQIANRRTLFILDNFDVDEDEDLPAFLSGDYRVLITTRNTHPGAAAIRVDTISDTAALTRMFEQNYGSPVDDRESLEAIFRLVDYHTYALELIAKQMEAGFLSPCEMRAALEQGKAAEQFSETVAGRHRRDTAFGHISSLFDIDKLDEEERWIMCCLSLTGVGGIKAPTLRQWAGLTNFETVNRLIRRSWVRRGKEQRLSLHPLVKEVIHARLCPDAHAMESFIREMGAYCYKAWYRSYTENLETADCVQATLEYFHGGTCEDFAFFESMVGYLWQVGRFDAAIRYGHLLYDACAEQFGVADMRTGFVAKALGGCYFNSSRLEESVAWYDRGFACMRDSGAPESEDLAMSYEKVGRCRTWAFCRDFPMAKRCLEESLAIRLRLKERILGGEVLKLTSDMEPYDLDVVTERIGESYMELGRMYQQMGQYDAALECTKNFRACQKEGHAGENSIAYAHFDMGVSHYHLALQNQQAGKEAEAEDHFSEAERLLDNALQSNLRLRGSLAVDTIENQAYLAEVYAARGQYGKAANAYMAALGMAEQLLGKDSDTAERIRQRMNFSEKTV